MNITFRRTGLAVLLVAALGLSGCTQKYNYETVPNDPLKARIYTLENGLKVYMTVNKEQPRIQTYIAVRVGGKNDPAETTGLAHYFEHLMFKGTANYGTMNYEAEKPLLDQIEQQFEVYRKTTDEAQRTAIYHTIDSLSYEASKYAIPNEYDKLMAAIGASGTNAYTSYDVTCYTEDIPSNQVENWAKIQAERFQNCVIRGFHTELETVYEEKNMSLTDDGSKVYEAMLAALFPHHPYGTQTVLGTQDNLKNPSITNIKKYFEQWYVPNNMAVCLSGDFDPDKTIAIIDRYFGTMKPNHDLPVLQKQQEPEITTPVVREVLGHDAEDITLAWRFPGAADRDAETLQVVSQVLYNGQAGLIDLDITQQQTAQWAFSAPVLMSDYSMLMLKARPKAGQSLDEAKDLLLAEVAKLRNGDFDEDMLKAILNNLKLYQLYQQEENSVRADMFVQSFINGSDWADEVTALDRISKLTKDDIVAFANKYLKDTNYAAIYKRQGQDPNEKKIAKPQITPIVMNRDTASAYLREIQQSQAQPIEPVFLDFSKDLEQFTTSSGIPVIYKQNTDNDLFTLVYLFDMGNDQDKTLGTAMSYLDYLGTSDKTPEEVKKAFYELACTPSATQGSRRSYLSLSGLNENMPEALDLYEELLNDAQVNREAYDNLVADILKSRQDNKLNQARNFSNLLMYVAYGPKNPVTNIVSENELKGMDPQALVDRIHRLTEYKHRILYYGPSTKEELLAVLDKEHDTPDELKNVPVGNKFKLQRTGESRIYLAPYDAKNVYLTQVSNRGEVYNSDIEPSRLLYNEYFGGGMNSIVFQEMRESRSLAYSAWAGLNPPAYKDEDYYFITQISSQNDKLIDAVNTFNDIINNMPQSEHAFLLAKDGMIARLRTERITKMDVIWSYINALDLGETTDSRAKLYNDLQDMTLQDVVDFQQKWIKGRTYNYGILGNKAELDMQTLQKIAPVVELKQEDIFGY